MDHMGTDTHLSTGWAEVLEGQDMWQLDFKQLGLHCAYTYVFFFRVNTLAI